MKQYLKFIFYHWRLFGSFCTWPSGMDKSSLPFPLLQGLVVKIVVSFEGLIFLVVLFLMMFGLEGVFDLGLENILVFSLSSELSTLATTFVGFGVTCSKRLFSYGEIIKVIKRRNQVHTYVVVVFWDFFFFLVLVVVWELGSHFKL